MINLIYTLCVGHFFFGGGGGEHSHFLRKRRLLFIEYDNHRGLRGARFQETRSMSSLQLYKKLYDVIRDDLRNQNRCKIVEIDRDEEM